MAEMLLILMKGNDAGANASYGLQYKLLLLMLLVLMKGNDAIASCYVRSLMLLLMVIPMMHKQKSDDSDGYLV